jgi:hypothetical protein
MATYENYERDRDVIINVLSDAGWSVTPTGEMVEAAELEYDNGTFTLQVDHNRVEKPWFNLTMSNAEGIERTFLIEFGNRLDEVLAAIIAHQDDLSEETFASVLDDLYFAAEEIYMYTENGPVPLPVILAEGRGTSAIIVETLSRVGWSPAPNSSGNKADMVFANDALKMELIQAEPDDAPDEKRAVFLIVGSRPPEGAALAVYTGPSVHRVLKIVTRYQDELTVARLPTLIQELISQCPDVYAILDNTPHKIDSETMHALQRAASA